MIISMLLLPPLTARHSVSGQNAEYQVLSCIWCLTALAKVQSLMTGKRGGHSTRQWHVQDQPHGPLAGVPLGFLGAGLACARCQVATSQHGQSQQFWAHGHHSGERKKFRFDQWFRRIRLPPPLRCWVQNSNEGPGGYELWIMYLFDEELELTLR